MNDYIIITDSGCDISPEVLADWEVKSLDMRFHLDGEEHEYVNAEFPSKEFYDRMRNGSVFKTSALGTEDYRNVFEAELTKGLDILYIGFSSGLSNTVNAGQITARELQEEFPDRRIIAVDSLCASAGQGLLVYLAVQKRKQGSSIDDTATYVLDTRLKICHWFTVNDLVYLKRGGRVSTTAAIAGALLNIKPVLHVDDEGHLINMLKVRGRKQSLTTIAKKFEELAEDSKNGMCFISHGDCIDEAKELAEYIRNEYGAKTMLITDIGAVIGSHSGPGTIALFFVGKAR